MNQQPVTRLKFKRPSNWLDIDNDFRPVKNIYVSNNDASGTYRGIPNPRPFIKNSDPMYINTSSKRSSSQAWGPYACLYDQSLSLPLIKQEMESISNICDIHCIENEKQSIHTYLLAAAVRWLREEKPGKKINLLEIGTFDGTNARIMSLLEGNIFINTMDPAAGESSTSWVYKDHDQPNDWNKRHQLLREKNTSASNIKYYSVSSTRLLKDVRLVEEPDIIWVDGDHRFPQVAIDLAAILALYQKPLILIDDVYIARSSNPTVETIRFLARDLELDVYLHQKKTGYGKFVAIIGDNIPDSLKVMNSKKMLIEYEID